jgi:hypothetical protein
VRALEAAKALGIPCAGELAREELGDLVRQLARAGLVLPEKVGPFVGGGRHSY